MKTLSKAMVGTVAAGAMAIASATPALADHRDGNHDGISAGEIIAGALIIGGIAAVAGAADNDRDRGRDYRYDRAGYPYGGDYENGRGYGDGRGYDNDRGHGRGWGHGRGGWRGGSPRSAIERCVRAAESEASRHSYGRADVTDIRSVRERRDGYEVRGRIAVNTRGHHWRNGDRRYGDGWGGDYRGWNEGHRGYDSGSFSCRVEYGRITHLDIDGIRGL